MNAFKIPENDERVFSAARNTAFADFEDSMQNESALFAEVDYIITRNKKDFEKAAIPVVTTEDFLILANRRNSKKTLIYQFLCILPVHTFCKGFSLLIVAPIFKENG